MRKFVRNQILELLSTIWEGIKQAKTLEPRAAEGVLTDCYIAVQTVEQTMQSGFSPETFAKYTDSLHSFQQLLEDTNEAIAQGISVADITKKLKAELKKLRKTLLEEKEIKLEIVFFPYKASMWDALESIWFAARDDENCDAYVVPIPYYDKRPDGTFGTMHCEADLYPDYVPVVNWQAYDVENRRPDVIFIHNPYDNNNFVTSVHPDFYSERLRECTDMLVYIPYFVVSGDIPEHFCTAAGCIYAHKVIVQSEALREIYAKNIKAAIGSRFAKPLDKVAALGSPKFDKVLHACREAYPLPDAWKGLIGDRKVVFYNSSIGGILRGRELYLKKLRKILDAFRERDDVVLWWRPHPLSEATLQSMQPLLQSEYNEIVRAYRGGGWGIYDETPDMYQAVAWSDGYYGDWSSVVMLYLATGKPVMVGGICPSEVPLSFQDCLVFLDNHTILTSAFSNTLFKIDQETYEADFFAAIPEDESVPFKFNPILYRGTIVHEGVAYFPPFNAAQMAAYSLEDQTIEQFPLKPIPAGRPVNGSFHGAVAYGDYVFFIPCAYPAIMRLNTRTKEIDYYSDWVGLLQQEIKPGNGFVLYRADAVAGDSIFIPVAESNLLIEFRMDICRSVIHKIGKRGYCYVGACYDGKYVWLTPRRHGPAVRWNHKTGEIKEFREILAGNENIDKAFLAAVYCAGHVWFVPFMGRYGYRINVETNDVSLVEGLDMSAWESQDIKFTAVKEQGESIYIHSESFGRSVKLDCLSGKCRNIEIHFSKEGRKRLDRVMAERQLANTEIPTTLSGCFFTESLYFSLNGYLEYIARESAAEIGREKRERRRQAISKNAANLDGTSGEKIYRHVKNSILE